MIKLYILSRLALYWNVHLVELGNTFEGYQLAVAGESPYVHTAQVVAVLFPENFPGERHLPLIIGASTKHPDSLVLEKSLMTYVKALRTAIQALNAHYAKK